MIFGGRVATTAAAAARGTAKRGSPPRHRSADDSLRVDFGAAALGPGASLDARVASVDGVMLRSRDAGALEAASSAASEGFLSEAEAPVAAPPPLAAPLTDASDAPSTTPAAPATAATSVSGRSPNVAVPSRMHAAWSGRLPERLVEVCPGERRSSGRVVSQVGLLAARRVGAVARAADARALEKPDGRADAGSRRRRVARGRASELRRPGPVAPRIHASVRRRASRRASAVAAARAAAQDA